MANGEERMPLLNSGGSEDNSSTANYTKLNDAAVIEVPASSYTQVEVKQETARNLALSWKNISVSVKLPVKRKWCCREENKVPSTKQVLTNVNGVVQPGSLLAIMGASGAGKSTLLNVLTHRNTKSYICTGDIRVNGWQVGEGIKNVSAYVQQDDLFLSALTVREQLQFRALLRMDKKLGRVSRLNRVEEVIVEMGLKNCANTRIGNVGGGKKGISGGERKRLSFASEALTNPPIFFCDEPTSGLDTFMAQNIVLTLQKMAAKGRTILCTIHQPSSELFSLFSQILLLSEGRTAYMGTAEGAMQFFERLHYPCPTNYNPADHFIFTLAIIPGKEEECRKKAQAVCDEFTNGEEAANMFEAVNLLEQSANVNQHDPLLGEAVAGESRYEAPWFIQFRYLLWRGWISIVRDVILFRIRILQTVVLGIVLGLIYLQLTIDQKGVMNINGAIFLLITNTSFSNMFAVANSFPYELAIFLREYGTGLYRSDIYYFTKTIAEAPIFAATSIIFTTVTYWMIGLYSSWDAFLIAVATLLLAANVAVSLGYLISTLCGSVTVSLAVSPPLLIPFMLFGGLFVNNGNIPVYFIWLKALSWFRYANEVLMVNQWQNVHNITCAGPEFNTSDACLYKTGDDVLSYTSFDKDNIVIDIILMIALIVGFRLLSLMALVVRARRSKE